MKKKVLSLLLMVCLMFSMLPEMAFAEGTDDGGIKSWEDLRTAIGNASTSGNTIITIGADFPTSSVLSDPIRIQGGVQVTIQSAASGPFTIKRADGNKGPFFTFGDGNSNTLTLRNIILDGGGESLTNTPYAPLIYASSGTPGTISNLILESGVILQNNHVKGESGGAIKFETGNITMNSGSMIQNNSTDRSAGGICVLNSTLTMNGGSIRNNTVTAEDSSRPFTSLGGGVVLYSNGGNSVFNMNGGSITGNTAYIGGGVFISGGDSSVFNLSAGEISGNTANGYSGGGVYLSSAGLRDDTQLNGALMNIKGNPVISGNKGDYKGEKLNSDLFMQGTSQYSKSPAILRKNGEFTSGASVGILFMSAASNATILDSYGTFAVTEADKAYFFSNRATSTIKYDSGLNKIVAEEPPVITTTSLTDGVTGNAYNQTLVATGSKPIAWSVTEGTLPGGLSLDSSTGAISGTPTARGTFSFTIEATNSTSTIATKALSITIKSLTEAEYSTDGNTWTPSSFSVAINELNKSTSGGAIKLLSDVTIDADVVINKNTTIISDGGARTIKRGTSFSGNMFQIENGATLTLNSGNATGGHTLTIDGGAVWTGEMDTTLKRGTINEGIQKVRNLVWVKHGTFEMYDGVFLQNNDHEYAYLQRGGAVSVGAGAFEYPSAFNMHGGTIRNVHSNAQGGGVSCNGKYASFTMGGTASITGVSSSNEGGAVYTYNGGDPTNNISGVTINGGTISGNVSYRRGAGVLVTNSGEVSGKLTITGGQITGNKTICFDGEQVSAGGGVHYSSSVPLKISGNPVIKDNISVYYSKPTVNNLWISNIGSVINAVGSLTGAADTIGISTYIGNKQADYDKTMISSYDTNKGSNTLPAPFFSDLSTLRLISDNKGGLKFLMLTMETKPTAYFDALTMTLSNVSDGMKYSVDGGNSWINITTTSIDISNVTTAQGIKVYKAGNGTTTYDSAIQTINVTQAATPVSTDFTVTQPSSIGGIGSIACKIGVYMEFSLDNGKTWNKANTIPIPGGTTCLCRIPGKGNSLASNPYSITINKFNGTAETTPSAAINYETEKLVNLLGSTSYKINGTSISSSAAGEIPIDGQWFGKNISIIKPGNNTTTIDSTEQSLNIPARSTMPSPAPAGVNETAPANGDGKITNVTTAMEFSQNNTTWRDVTTNEAANGISGLGAGTYYVRIKATTGSFASLVTTLTIGTDKIPVTAVSISGAAKVGLTLNATIQPSNATVQYQWTANGTAVGTNAATYTVKAEDIGKTITVTVTGTGSYSGTVISDPIVPTMTTMEKGITIDTTAPVRDAAVVDGTNTQPTGATGPTVTWSSDDGVNYASASGTFAADTTYKTKYVYTANVGYEFDNSITGNDIIITNIGSGTKAVQLTDGNKTLTITVTWPATVVNPDIAAVDAAKTAAQNTTYADMAQGTATDEAAIKNAIKLEAVAAINDNNVTVTINKISYNAPIAGTSANPSGTNGSFVFTVTVTKGGQTQKTGEKTITITATAFTGDGADYSSGAPAGTSSAPRTYNISNETQLRDLAATVNSGTTYQYTTFVLQNDIALSGGDWTPIGILILKDNNFVQHPFYGTFDGNGKKITGVKIVSSSDPSINVSGVGLFGNVRGTIKNLGVEADIHSKIVSESINSSTSVGGLVGKNDGTIINSYATGNIIVEGKMDGVRKVVAGGLVGWNNGTITNSYATANVTGVSLDYLGGLVGLHNGTAINNSYATGNVICSGVSDSVGGLVGNSNNKLITNSYWNSDATQMVYGAAQSPKKGVGSGTSTGATSMTAISMQANSFVATLNANLDILADTALYKWQVKANDYPTFSDTLWSAPAITIIEKAITIGTVAPATAEEMTNGTNTVPTGATAPVITWSADNGASWTASGSFAAGTVYKTKYVYKANTGYQFDSAIEAGDISVTYLGKGTKNVELTDSNKTLTVTVTWPATAMAEVVTINGMVRDIDGNPVTGATVTLTPGAGTPNPATTGNDGKYTINNVPKGNYKVTVTLPNGGGSFTKDVTVYGGSLDIQQPVIPTYTVSGSIKDAVNNSPVSGATVTLTNQTNRTKVYTTTTDINGDYTITDVPDGSYEVDVTKNGETYGNAITVITVNGSNVSGGSGNIAVTIPTYTVTYYGNVNDIGAVPIDTAQYKKGASATVMGKGSLARNGYNFTEWNTASNGSGTSYKVNDIIVINEDVTLYAQWKAIDSAQIPIFALSNVRGTETVIQPAAANMLLVNAAVSDGGTLSYQWYKNTANTTAGAVAISSATDPSYTPPTDVVGTVYYYVVVTNTLTTQSGVKISTNTSGVKTVIVLGQPAAVYTVSTNPTTLSNITLDNTSATQYQNYTTNISADIGYSLPDRITVTMGDRTLVDGVDYIYSKTSTGAGTLKVYNVTGQIAITATGALIPTKVYTISFNSNGADAVGAISGKYGDPILVLPTPTKAGFSFAGWYRDSGFTTSYVSTTMGKEDITLFAKWQPITYDISGKVKDEDNVNVNSASVKLMAGSRNVAQVTTAINGDFTISGVPVGKYNLVITRGEQTITLVITVLNSNVTTGSVTLPNGKKNSVVEVKQDTPDIVVDKLNDFFNSEKYTQDDRNVVDAGGMVEIKLLVEKKDESGDNAAANANSIKTSAQRSGKTTGIFLNLTVSKIITPVGGAAEQPILIDQLSDLLIIDIPLPAELRGKSGYVIYRYHGAEVQTITEVANADGEYIEVSADGKSIKLHTKKFSTYAVGYTTPSAPPTSNTGGDSSGNTVQPSEGGKIVIGTDNKTATITPDNGYAIADVIVDGKRIGATEKYTFTDGDTHKISAVFVKKTAIPYYNQNGRKVYIGVSAIEENLYKYIAPANVTVEFMENPKYFIDNTIAWAKQSIDFVTERELFVGTGQNIFSPNEGMTRAMFVTVIGKVYENSFGSISGTVTFSDVDANAYYAKYVGWANENGIIKGIGENKFDPYANVTREQMAVIMYKFAALLNKAAVADVSLTYPDSASISSWGVEGAKYCQETKVIEGRTGGIFAPQESATRAEVAAVIERFIKTIMK